MKQKLVPNIISEAQMDKFLKRRHLIEKIVVPELKGAGEDGTDLKFYIYKKALYAELGARLRRVIDMRASKIESDESAGGEEIFARSVKLRVLKSDATDETEEVIVRADSDAIETAVLYLAKKKANVNLAISGVGPVREVLTRDEEVAKRRRLKHARPVRKAPKKEGEEKEKKSFWKEIGAPIAEIGVKFGCGAGLMCCVLVFGCGGVFAPVLAAFSLLSMFFPGEVLGFVVKPIQMLAKCVSECFYSVRFMFRKIKYKIKSKDYWRLGKLKKFMVGLRVRAIRKIFEQDKLRAIKSKEFTKKAKAEMELGFPKKSAFQVAVEALAPLKDKLRTKKKLRMRLRNISRERSGAKGMEL